MTFTSNPTMLIEEDTAGNVSTQSRVQDKHVWKSLRSHIISRREKNKQAEADAEVLRKKKCVEFQKMEENKLSLAQINGRLSALRDRREELEEEKRILLNQVQATDQATPLIVPKSEPNSEPLNNKLILTNNMNNAVVSNQRSSNLLQPQQHLYRQQTSVNAQQSSGSPVAGSSLSPLTQQSLLIQNSNANMACGSNQTLLVCSPATINAVAANNQNNNSSTRSSIPLSSSMSNTMTFTKFSSLYSSNSSHLLPPNLGTSNKLGRTPSPQPPSIQQQSYHHQQPIVVPFPTYKSMNNSSGASNILNSSPGVVNNINQSIVNATNNSYILENINRRGSRDETPSSFSRNVSMWNNNNPNKNTQPSVSIYGSFYQPPASAVNYCVNNSISSSPSSSSVNTVYSYSGPPHSMSRSESTGIGSLMVSASASDHGAQISKTGSSHQQQQHHQHHHGHTNPPMYMSPGIRNQTNNHAYHPKPSQGLYGDDKLIPPPTNYYQQQNSRSIHSANAQSQLQMSQKTHNLNYLRQPASSAASQLSPVIQPSQHGSYSVPTSSITGYSTKSPGPVTAATDVSRYQHQSQPQSSRDMNN